jgi:hypothetical protein
VHKGSTRIPPTGAGGSLESNLQTSWPSSWEFHQRQLVVC